jgi:hypothetical protein
VTAPFQIYVKEWPIDFTYTGVDDQAEWLKQARGGEIPPEVLDSMRKIHKIARDNNVSFPELAAYALDPTQGTTGKQKASQ